MSRKHFRIIIFALTAILPLRAADSALVASTKKAAKDVLGLVGLYDDPAENNATANLGSKEATNRNYPLKLTSDGSIAYVTVPWTDTNTTYTAGTGISIDNSSNNSISLQAATTSVLGGVKLAQAADSSALTLALTASTNTTGANFPLRLTNSQVAYVNIPQMTMTAPGVAKLGAPDVTSDWMEVFVPSYPEENMEDYNAPLFTKGCSAVEWLETTFGFQSECHLWLARHLPVQTQNGQLMVSVPAGVLSVGGKFYDLSGFVELNSVASTGDYNDLGNRLILNGNYDALTSYAPFYAPTSGGIAGQILTSTGPYSAPEWAAAPTAPNVPSATTSVSGVVKLGKVKDTNVTTLINSAGGKYFPIQTNSSDQLFVDLPNFTGAVIYSSDSSGRQFTKTNIDNDGNTYGIFGYVMFGYFQGMIYSKGSCVDGWIFSHAITDAYGSLCGGYIAHISTCAGGGGNVGGKTIPNDIQIKCPAGSTAYNLPNADLNVLGGVKLAQAADTSALTLALTASTNTTGANFPLRLGNDNVAYTNVPLATTSAFGVAKLGEAKLASLTTTPSSDSPSGNSYFLGRYLPVQTDNNDKLVVAISTPRHRFGEFWNDNPNGTNSTDNFKFSGLSLVIEHTVMLIPIADRFNYTLGNNYTTSTQISNPGSLYNSSANWSLGGENNGLGLIKLFASRDVTNLDWFCTGSDHVDCLFGIDSNDKHAPLTDNNNRWLRRIKERNYPVKLDMAGVAYVTVPWKSSDELRDCSDWFSGGSDYNNYSVFHILCQENTSTKTITVSFRLQRTQGNAIGNAIEELMYLKKDYIWLYTDRPELTQKFCTTHMYYNMPGTSDIVFNNMGYAYIETNTSPNYLAIRWINSPVGRYYELSRETSVYITILIDCTFMYKKYGS
jgi:hypothetical protein